jgi:hypothetical protein
MLALVTSLLLSAATGDVVDSSPSGFTSQITVQLTASPDGVLRGRLESLAKHVVQP